MTMIKPENESSQKNVAPLLVGFFELLDPRPDWGSGPGAFLDGGEHFPGFGRVLPGNHHAIIELDPGFSGILHRAMIGFKPVSQTFSALFLGGFESGLQTLRQ